MNVSAMRHPKLQMSIALEYFLEPRIISGARYHLVAMYSVITCYSSSSCSSTARTSPKSQTLASHSSLMSMLEGFKSLWMRPPE